MHVCKNCVLTVLHFSRHCIPKLFLNELIVECISVRHLIWQYGLIQRIYVHECMSHLEMQLLHVHAHTIDYCMRHLIDVVYSAFSHIRNGWDRPHFIYVKFSDM